MTHQTIISGGLGCAALLLALSGAAGCEGPDGSTTEGAAAVTGVTSMAGSTGATTAGDADTTAATTGEATTGGAATSDDGGPASTGEVDDPCEDSILRWDNFGGPFMSTWCTPCHHSSSPTAGRAGAPCSVNFDRHGDVKFRALQVLDLAVVQEPRPMPPATFIPEDELALLKQYLECGAPGPDRGEAFSTCPDLP